MEVYEFNQKGLRKLHYIRVGDEQAFRRFQTVRIECD